jgi:hypothetical protein
MTCNVKRTRHHLDLGIIEPVALQCICSVSLQFRFLNYRGADKPLARPTSRCILFDGENISFDASLVLYIYIYIYIYIVLISLQLNRIYENQNLLRCSLLPSWSG